MTAGAITRICELVGELDPRYTIADLATLAYVLGLGPAGLLHAQSQAAELLHEPDGAGGLIQRAPGDDQAQVRAAALHLFRIASRLAGVRLPPPGVMIGDQIKR